MPSSERSSPAPSGPTGSCAAWTSRSGANWSAIAKSFFGRFAISPSMQRAGPTSSSSPRSPITSSEGEDDFPVGALLHDGLLRPSRISKRQLLADDRPKRAVGEPGAESLPDRGRLGLGQISHVHPQDRGVAHHRFAGMNLDRTAA